MEQDEYKHLVALIADAHSQVTALNTTVRALIETHPDRGAVDAVLARQQFRLESLLLATPIPDQSIARVHALLRDMRTIAQRTPE